MKQKLNINDKCYLAELLAVSIIITISLFLIIQSLFKTDFTIDERNAYLRIGKEIIHSLDFDRIQLSYLHPPLTFYLHGLPFLLTESKNSYEELFLARLAMLPIFILFSFILFFFSKKFFGRKAAFFSLILFCFNPEIIAHARLITPDFTLAFFIFLFLILFYQFLKTTKSSYFIFSGIVLGLCFSTKYTGLLLIPISIVILLIDIFANNRQRLHKLLKFVLICLIALLTVNLSYGFRGSFNLPNFKSVIFKRLSEKNKTQILLKLFPKNYLIGVEYQLNEATSHNKRNFFAGYRSETNIWYFFLATFLLKTPISLLILILAIFLLDMLQPKRANWFLNFCIIFPVLFFIFYFSFFNNLNIGFRYILMVYPLLIFYVGRLANTNFKNRRGNLLIKLFLIISIFCYIRETIKIHPYYLAYANQFIGGPKNAYKYWTDSTLDWQQDNRYFFQYLNDNMIRIPIDPKKPVLGKFAVSVLSMNLDNYYEYKWLRAINKKPVAQYGYTWLIFDISESDLQKLSTGSYE